VTSAPPSESRSFEFQGVRYHTLVQGRGPAVLLLHGGGNHAGQWRGQLAALAVDYTVIAPDLLVGSGRSIAPAPDWPFTLQGDAAVLAALLDEHQVGCAHVIGHSYGGTVALAMAIASPERVASLALIEPNPSGLMRNGGPDARAALVTSARWGARMRCATADDEAEAVMAAFVDSRRGPGTWAALSPRAQQSVLASRSAFVRGFEALLAFAPAPATVAELGMPVLLLGSQLSTPDFRAALEFVGQLLPHAERRTISGVGHFGVIEKPEAFEAPLLQWLARANAATSARAGHAA
jgi:pimeloyl-ACP methyl ester carboxylesterase